MATEFFMTADNPEMGVIQAALNGMDVIENVLCHMHNLALIAATARDQTERQRLAARFDCLRRDLDFIAAGTLGIGKANGDCQIFPAEYRDSPHAMIAVCEADGNDCWLRLSGLPPFCRLPAHGPLGVRADRDGNVDLAALGDGERRNVVFESVYALLGGEAVAVLSANGLVETIAAASHPRLRLYINGLNNGWAEPFGHARAIQTSVEETRSALDSLHATATSFGAYIFRLYQRYGFGDAPANDL